MKKIISNKVGSIIKEKEKLETALNVKISNRGKELFIDGSPVDEYEAEKVIEAINFGFKTEIAIMIKEKELSLEILSIKDFTKKEKI